MPVPELCSVLAEFLALDLRRPQAKDSFKDGVLEISVPAPGAGGTGTSPGDFTGKQKTIKIKTRTIRIAVMSAEFL
jgi:hypothetical protein